MKLGVNTEKKRRDNLK